jgi:hypothetical protein
VSASSYLGPARHGAERPPRQTAVCETPAGSTIAERLRAEVSHLHSDDGDPLTMSFGVVEFPRDGRTRAALIHAADRALREAKALGRNRSIVQRSDSVDGVRQALKSDGHRFRRTPATPVAQRTMRG